MGWKWSLRTPGCPNLRALIGTKSMSQQRQLNSSSFVLWEYKCRRFKWICGGRDQRHGQICLGHWELQDHWTFRSRLVDGTKQFDQGIADHVFDPSLHKYTDIFCIPQNERITIQLSLLRHCLCANYILKFPMAIIIMQGCNNCNWTVIFSFLGFTIVKDVRKDVNLNKCKEAYFISSLF